MTESLILNNSDFTKYPKLLSQNLIKLLGENETPERVEKLISEVDTDGDGMISFEEFLVMFRKDNYLAAREELSEAEAA